MAAYYSVIPHGYSELYHYGIPGMKWGVRRYQHEDGTRTSLGKKHEQQLDNGSTQTSRRAIKAQYRSNIKAAKAARKKRFQESTSEYGKTLDAIESKYKRGQTISGRDQKLEVEAGNRYDKAIDESNLRYKGDRAKAKADYKKAMSDLKNSPEFKAEKDARRKKIMIGTAVVAGTALAAYGTYKLSKGNYLKYTDLGKNSLKSSIKNYNLANINAGSLSNDKAHLKSVLESYRHDAWKSSDQLQYLHKNNARKVADAVGYIKKGDSDYAKAASYYDKAAKTIYSRIKNKK